MARISVVRTVGTYRVTLAGRLMAADLKRLERACRHALEHKLVPLELNLDHVSATDAAARFYVEQLRARGATIHDATGALRVGEPH
ncbi:MAG: hypothetical protein DMF89_07495 [Acidobacteria bacterium]|nr:MAG: hypothetical protein DMF90_03715 [Acidobacteriota bacterium]PYR50972.1 MAG: hypothetical protein DMF89_07495 [Acidobacteriota bacterium]